MYKGNLLDSVRCRCEHACCTSSIPSGTADFSEIVIKIQKINSGTNIWNISFAKWRSFCLGGDVLIETIAAILYQYETLLLPCKALNVTEWLLQIVERLCFGDWSEFDNIGPTTDLQHSCVTVQWDLCPIEPIVMLCPGDIWMIFEISNVLISVYDNWGISRELALWWLSRDFPGDKSTLIKVIVWCRQATTHYPCQCWHISMLSYGVTRPRRVYALRWRHNDHDRVSNHQPHGCLLNHLLRRRSDKHQSCALLTFVWGIHRDRWIPRNKRASYAENVSIWWHHHVPRSTV